MRNGNHGLRRGLALATVISAIAAPTAGAVPIDSNLPTPHRAPDIEAAKDQLYVGSVTALSPPVSSPTAAAEPTGVSGDGFDWGDAGIGAGAMLALTAIAGGAALALGPRRSRHGVA